MARVRQPTSSAASWLFRELSRLRKLHVARRECAGDREVWCRRRSFSTQLLDIEEGALVGLDERRRSLRLIHRVRGDWLSIERARLAEATREADRRCSTCNRAGVEDTNVEATRRRHARHDAWIGDRRGIERRLLVREK